METTSAFTIFVATTLPSFASTEEGFYSAPLSGVNHAFFGSWTRDDRLPLQKYNTFCLYKDQIYVNHASDEYDNDTLYVFDNGQWDYMDTTNLSDVFKLNAYGDTLLIVSRYPHYYYNNLQSEFVVHTYNQTGFKSTPNARDAFFEPNGHLWTADNRFGLVWSPKQWTNELIIPDGPAYTPSFAMDCKNGALWVVSGGVQSNWNNNYEDKGFYHFIDEQWNSYNNVNIPALDSIQDVVSIAVDPTNAQHAFVGSWGQGLLELDGGQLTQLYDQDNSILSEASNRPGFVGIGGLCYDNEGNLWISNSANPIGIGSLQAR